MNPAGKLLIVDVVLSETNEPVPQKAMMDLMMLTLTNGHERTQAEFNSLLESCGFSLQRVIETGTGNSIVEATRS